MMPKWHFIASFVLSAFIFVFTGSTTAALACLFAGTLPDIDHVLDYYLYSGHLSLKPSEISGFYRHFGKVYVVFHSYELLILAIVAGFVYDAPLLVAGMGLGFLGHIVMDIMAYEMKPQSYSFVYRMMNGFEMGRLCGINSD